MYSGDTIIRSLCPFLYRMLDGIGVFGIRGGVEHIQVVAFHIVVVSMLVVVYLVLVFSLGIRKPRCACCGV